MPQRASRPRHYSGEPPGGVIEADLIGPVDGTSEVERLPRVQVVERGRTIGCAPLPIRRNDGSRAVVVRDAEGCSHTGFRVPRCLLPAPGVEAGHAVEATTDLDGDDIDPLVKLLRHIRRGLMH